MTLFPMREKRAVNCNHHSAGQLRFLRDRFLKKTLDKYKRPIRIFNNNLRNAKLLKMIRTRHQGHSRQRCSVAGSHRAEELLVSCIISAFLCPGGVFRQRWRKPDGRGGQSGGAFVRTGLLPALLSAVSPAQLAPGRPPVTIC